MRIKALIQAPAGTSHIVCENIDIDEAAEAINIGNNTISNQDRIIL